MSRVVGSKAESSWLCYTLSRCAWPRTKYVFPRTWTRLSLYNILELAVTLWEPLGRGYLRSAHSHVLYHYIFLYPFSRSSSLSIFLTFSSSLVFSILLYLCRLCVLRFQSLVTPSLFNHLKYFLCFLILFHGSTRSRFLTVCIFVPRPLQLCLGSLSGGNVPPLRIKIWHRTMPYLSRWFTSVARPYTA